MQDADRVLEGCVGEDVGRLQVPLDELDDLPACGFGDLRPGASRRRDRGPPGRVSPSASVTQAIVEAVPIVMQWPFERDIAFSISSNSASVIRPARSSSL